jgi:hypothetical protein
MVVHFVPAHRVVALLESLTGTAPSVGFVHGMINRTAGLLDEVHQRIRTLITLAYAVCCDETPLRVGPRKPAAGKKKSERYLLVACTELYTHYLLGDRSLTTFTAFVVAKLSGSVIVHDRYQNYDSAALGPLVHQLCTAHLLRDLDDAAQVYPDSIWPVQLADALRALIGEANRAREQGLAAIPGDVRDELLRLLRNGMLVGLSDTLSASTRPGERKARLLLEVLRDRPDDDLRPSKIQQKISGRLTSIKRTEDRYTILGYLSTAAKHGLDKITVLRDALTGQPWMPALPAPT